MKLAAWENRLLLLCDCELRLKRAPASKKLKWHKQVINYVKNVATCRIAEWKKVIDASINSSVYSSLNICFHNVLWKKMFLRGGGV